MLAKQVRETPSDHRAVRDRRSFLRSSLVLAGMPLAIAVSKGLSMPGFASQAQKSSHAWQQLAKLLERIRPPVFPKREFDVTEFGAVGDNQRDSTAAFAQAVSACNRAGGGVVLIPQGEFLTGAIRLKSNVNLHLAEGATIRFSRDPSNYPLVFTRWEGVELMNYSPFIYALGEKDIAITGKGTIDGNADCEHWWPWAGHGNCNSDKATPDQKKDRDRLFALAENHVPVQDRVFGPGHWLRPQFIQPYRCSNVLIEGVTLLNSPMWQVHPVLCTNVIVRGLMINSSGPNTDGCDPESCSDVLIENCFFNTGDDCIAVKSGRNEDGRRLHAPSENIVIRNCHMRDGHGGVTLGSEISGGVRNIFAENCTMDSPHLFSAIRIKNNAMRGGLIENIYARNIAVGQVSMAGISIDFFYEEGEAGKFIPVVRNVEVSNLTTRKAGYALFLRGFRHAPIENVQLTDCDFEGVEKKSVIENVQGIAFDDVRINGARVSSAS
jgi:polygalacturonase